MRPTRRIERIVGTSCGGHPAVCECCTILASRTTQTTPVCNSHLDSALRARSFALAMRRPDLNNRLLVVLVAGVIVALVLYFWLVRPLLPVAWRTPGSPTLYVSGVVGALLLLVSMAFVVAKRTGRGGSPQVWFIAHVVCATLGSILIAVHFRRIPAPAPGTAVPGAAVPGCSRCLGAAPRVAPDGGYVREQTTRVHAGWKFGSVAAGCRHFEETGAAAFDRAAGGRGHVLTHPWPLDSCAAVRVGLRPARSRGERSLSGTAPRLVRGKRTGGRCIWCLPTCSFLVS